jgi:hypothetical protein
MKEFRGWIGQFRMWFSVFVLFFLVGVCVGLAIGTNAASTTLKKRAISAEVAHYVITDPATGATEFQFKEGCGE